MKNTLLALSLLTISLSTSVASADDYLYPDEDFMNMVYSWYDGWCTELDIFFMQKMWLTTDGQPVYTVCRHPDYPTYIIITYCDIYELPGCWRTITSTAEQYLVELPE